jgi:Ca2+/Na+ antiporter
MLIFLGGLVLLVVGANLLVRGASRLAAFGWVIEAVSPTGRWLIPTIEGKRVRQSMIEAQR